MKNRIAKKVCAAALAGLMTMALVPTSVFAAGTMTIGWQRGIYPIRATAETAVSLGDLFVLEDG